MLEESPSAFSSDIPSARVLPLDHFRDRTRDEPENFIIGGFRDDALIATAGAYRETGEKRHHMATVWGMFVHPDHRRAGLGHQLLTGVLERLTQLPGVERVELAVTVGNDSALALYESFGFEIYGREPDALRIADTGYDEFHLSLKLS